MKEHLRTAIWRDIIISLRKRRFNSADGDKEEKNMTVKELPDTERPYEKCLMYGADALTDAELISSIKKFAKKFLDDGSFRSLKDNLVQKNGEEAFRAAHTLKGVCQNLGFDNLYKASFDITEKLRGRDTEGCEELLAKVEEQYNNTVDAIHMMED